MMDEFFLNYKSLREEDTLLIGKKTGELVETGQIILLSGELGSGKTVFVQGLAEGLGIETKVTSPTYKLINEYEGQLPLYHMDLYRLEDEVELYEIGFEEYLDRDGVIVIEWPDLAYGLLPPDFLYIRFETIDNDIRELEIEAEGNQGKSLLEGLAEYVNTGD